MTEDDIDQIQKAVDQITIDPTIESQWVEKQLAEVRKAEQETACAFKLHKFLRKDEQMRQNETQLKELRSIIAYLEREQIRLNRHSINDPTAKR